MFGKLITVIAGIFLAIVALPFIIMALFFIVKVGFIIGLFCLAVYILLSVLKYMIV
jgi:hypothetical protein